MAITIKVYKGYIFLFPRTYVVNLGIFSFIVKTVQ